MALRDAQQLAARRAAHEDPALQPRSRSQQRRAERLEQRDEADAVQRGYVHRVVSALWHAAMDDGMDQAERERERRRQETVREESELPEELRRSTLDAQEAYLVHHCTSLRSVRAAARAGLLHNVLYGTSLHDMLARHADPLELRQHGHSVDSLRAENVTASVLFDHGYSLVELRAFGCTFSDLLVRAARQGCPPGR